MKGFLTLLKLAIFFGPLVFGLIQYDKNSRLEDQIILLEKKIVSPKGRSQTQRQPEKIESEPAPLPSAVAREPTSPPGEEAVDPSSGKGGSLDDQGAILAEEGRKMAEENSGIGYKLKPSQKGVLIYLYKDGQAVKDTKYPGIIPSQRKGKTFLDFWMVTKGSLGYQVWGGLGVTKFVKSRFTSDLITIKPRSHANLTAEEVHLLLNYYEVSDAKQKQLVSNADKHYKKRGGIQKGTPI